MKVNLHSQTSRTLRTCILAVIFCATLALLLPGGAYGQGSDRKNATLVTAREIRSTADYPTRIGTGYSKTLYYYFMAGPGVVTAEVLTSAGTGDYAYSVVFENSSGGTLQHIDFNFSGWGDNDRNRTFSLSARTRVLMVVKLTGRFDYSIRLGGNLDIPIATIGPLTKRGPTETRLAVPTGGRLQIRMRDGSTQSFDLSLVQEVVVIR